MKGVHTRVDYKIAIFVVCISRITELVQDVLHLSGIHISNIWRRGFGRELYRRLLCAFFFKFLLIAVPMIKVIDLTAVSINMISVVISSRLCIHTEFSRLRFVISLGHYFTTLSKAILERVVAA
jgi:hypothetical protein